MRSRLLLRIGYSGLILAGLLLFADGAAEARSLKVLYDFAGNPDGVGPYSSVVFDKKGSLYGTTIHGGAAQWGTVFRLKRQPDGSWTEKLLHSFEHGGVDGEQPTGTPLIDPSGNLYGTTELGGAYHAGTAFQLTPGPGGWSFQTIYQFCSQPDCADGGAPYSGLIADPAGNLYGVYTTVFELSPSPSGWNESTLYAFCSKTGCEDGNGSYSSPLLDDKGNLFGVTYGGGNYNVGTVYEVKKLGDGSWKERVLHHFGNPDKRDGQLPFGPLAVDATGSLYGTTTQGGSHSCGEVGCGTIFRLTRQPDGHWDETILHNFNLGKGGYAPFGGVVIDQSGNLYGTASGGGSDCDCGVIYKLSPNSDDTWTYTVLHRFVGSDGAFPGANLTFDDKGNLYGTAVDGGLGFGVVFELTP